jgi:hypothetical protein
MPQFIKYIEDNDLTTNKLSKTEAFTAALGTKLSFHHIDFFKTWDKLLNPAVVESMIEDGTKYQEYKNYLLKRNMHISSFKKLGGFSLLVANFGTVGLASDLGNKISDANPTVDIVLLWSYHYNTREYSIMLRTRKPGINLAAIAKLYGGGGHPGAARFAWKNGDIEKLFEDMNTRLRLLSKTKSDKKSMKLKPNSKFRLPLHKRSQLSRMSNKKVKATVKAEMAIAELQEKAENADLMK